MSEYGINGNILNLSTLQLKYKAASEWQATDRLLSGEIGIETDTHKLKIGDGVNTWGNLPYSADPAKLTSLEARITALETLAAAIRGVTSSVIDNVDKSDLS